jgi:hypothetical protein
MAISQLKLHQLKEAVKTQDTIKCEVTMKNYLFHRLFLPDISGCMLNHLFLWLK